MNKLWVSKQTKGDIPKNLHPDPHVARLLYQRGIKSQEEAERFFHPQIEHLHDPFLMKDMDKAVERLKQAVDEKERICVYGDYDGPFQTRR